MNRAKWDRRKFLAAAASGVAVASLSRSALAADPVKIGLIVPKTGPFASTGRQVEAACRLYMQKNGDTRAGRKVELVVRDDTGTAPELTKRLAQELVVRDQVQRARGIRPDAARVRRGAGRDRNEGADDRHGGGDVGHPAALAVHRALRLHAAASHGADRRMGVEERHQQGRDARLRLRARHRRGEDVRQALHRARRHGGRIGARAAAQSRLRAVRAARQGREGRRAVRVRAVRRRARR